MRRLILCIGFLFCTCFAQPSRELMLNKFTYVPETSHENAKPLLNSDYYRSLLDPIPMLELPKALPVEFHEDRDYLKVYELYQQAGEAMKTEDFQKAVELMEAATKLKPDEDLLRIMYADSLLSNKQYTKAKKIYEDVLEKAPNQYQCLNNLAWMLATATESEWYNPERALNLSIRASLVSPRNHYIWSTLSEAQFRLGRYQEAEQSINFALKLANASAVPIEMIVSYMFKRDTYILAREATSLLE